MDEQPSPSVSDPASALTRRGFAGLALHSWTVDALSLEEVLQLAAETGFDAVELRYVDFARALASQSEADLIAAVKVAGVPVCALGVVYGWIYATGAEQENLFEAFKRSCERAAKLGCPTLMTGAGAGEGSVTQAADALARAGEIAGGFDLSVVFEFAWGHPGLSSLETALTIRRQAGRNNVGLVLDSYHLTRTGGQASALQDLSADDIGHVQISDVPTGPPPTQRPPTDRLLPGEGTIDWPSFLDGLAASGYRGYLSLEAPSPRVWSLPPETLAQDTLSGLPR